MQVEAKTGIVHVTTASAARAENPGVGGGAATWSMTSVFPPLFLQSEQSERQNSFVDLPGEGSGWGLGVVYARAMAEGVAGQAGASGAESSLKE